LVHRVIVVVLEVELDFRLERVLALMIYEVFREFELEAA